jgi:hypothetical protein
MARTAMLLTRPSRDLLFLFFSGARKQHDTDDFDFGFGFRDFRQARFRVRIWVDAVQSYAHRGPPSDGLALVRPHLTASRVKCNDRR